MRKTNRVKTLLILLLFGVSAMIVTSCYSDYGLSTSDYDIVATFRDDATNFQSYKTYYMPDTIKTLSDAGSNPSDVKYEDQILNEIASQMQAYGYERVSNKANADIEVYVGVTSSENYSYYPGYWWGYWGWYYPWYGGYYYSYTTGSLFVTMFDPSKFNQVNKITGAVWAGTANGILDDTNANILSRTINSIDKMFEQSPYLKLIP